MNPIDALQLIIIAFVIGLVLFFYMAYGKKNVDIDFFVYMISAVMTGGAIYEGIMWILKPFGILHDPGVYNSPLYNILIGSILILFAIIAVKTKIESLDNT